MTKKMFAYCPYPQDSTSYYRGMGVMTDLKKKFNGKLTIEHRKDGEGVKLWNTFDDTDVLFVQRPASPDLVQMMDYFKKVYHRPVWIDYDDNLFELPKYNQAYKHYEKQEIKDNVMKCIQIADVVTVTTHELKRYLDPLNQNIIVVPNAFNNSTIDISRRANIERKNSAMWRGSGTHIGDVDQFKYEVQQIMIEHADHKFFWIGSETHQLYHVFDESFYPHSKGNAHKLEALDPNLYLLSIEQLGSKVVHVPLADNLFNRAKSNIALIEGSWAGMATIAPDWQEWQLPGTLLYKNNKDYYDLMNSALKGDIDVVKSASETWQYVQENLLLSKVNMLRMKILKELL